MSGRPTTMASANLRPGVAASFCAAILLILWTPEAVAQVGEVGERAGDVEALFLGAPARPVAVPLDEQVQQRLVLLLSGYEYFPSAEDLAGVVEDATPYLLDLIYEDGDEVLTFHRHRAIGALAYYPSELVSAHLTYLLTSPNTPYLTRHHVMNALARGFGDAALSQLEAYLYDDDLQLRLTAVSAIGSVATAASADCLVGALDLEEHDLVRQRIQRQLTTRAGTQLR